MSHSVISILYDIYLQGELAINTLISQMCRPDFYPHEVSEPIEVIQTHTCHIFLTGAYAYKIKKAVHFEFVDFSTIEKRHYYCLEELRLNKAFASVIYLNVIPIYQYKDSYSFICFSDKCHICEYAIQMIQFDNSTVLSHMLEQEPLTPSLVDQLGQRISQLHKQTPAVDPASGHGTALEMKKTVQVCFKTIQPFKEAVLPNTLCCDLEYYLCTFIDEHENIFKIRVKQKKIRECHGDLHLDNIFLHDGKVQVFDRIEFNQDFSHIDTMYDLAFLLMDLSYRGETEAANRLLNVYLEFSADYGGVVLLPFYQSLRALIRCEVSLLKSTDSDIDERNRELARTEGVRYLHHALEYSRKGQGAIVVMCGLSGSGKSTIALTISSPGEFIHIRSDALRKHIAGIQLSDRECNIYTDSYTKSTYTKLIETGIMLSLYGHKVILDAKFDQSVFRRQLLKKAVAFGIPTVLVHCHAPSEVLKSRLKHRKGDISDATEELTEYQSKQFEPFTTIEKKYTLSLNTNDELKPEAILEQLLIV